MLAVVTDQMASSETVLEQQRRDLIKIHGEASVRKAALYSGTRFHVTGCLYCYPPHGSTLSEELGWVIPMLIPEPVWLWIILNFALSEGI